MIQVYYRIKLGQHGGGHMCLSKVFVLHILRPIYVIPTTQSFVLCSFSRLLVFLCDLSKTNTRRIVLNFLFDIFSGMAESTVLLGAVLKAYEELLLINRKRNSDCPQLRSADVQHTYLDVLIPSKWNVQLQNTFILFLPIWHQRYISDG